MHERVGGGGCDCSFLARPGRRAFRWVRGAAAAAAAVAIAVSVVTGTPARAANFEDLEVIAHRGGNDFGPEHTLGTLRHAIAVGSDAVEVDVRFTVDNVPVLMHDFTLDRTTDCTGPVNAVTSDDLARCNAGGGQQVPTLRETLALFAPTDVHVYLHVKSTDRDEHLAQIVAEIERFGLNDGRRATTMGDGEKLVERLRRAGSNRLGLVFNKPAGWSAQYPVLIAYNTPMDPELVARAQQRGSHVVTVQDHLVSLRELVKGRVPMDGYMANHLDSTLYHLGRALRPDGATVRPHRLPPQAPPSDDFPTIGLDGA